MFHFYCEGSSFDFSSVPNITSHYFTSVSDQNDKRIQSPSFNQPRPALGPTKHPIQCTVSLYPWRGKQVEAWSWTLSPPSSSVTHNTSITPTRLHGVIKRGSSPHFGKDGTTHIKSEGCVIQLRKSKGFVEFNTARRGEVCSSLLVAQVTHIQWEALWRGLPLPSDIQRTVLHTASLSKLSACLYST